jgi:hypothetical protein
VDAAFDARPHREADVRLTVRTHDGWRSEVLGTAG